jgi:hypothetical protein
MTINAFTQVSVYRFLTSVKPSPSERRENIRSRLTAGAISDTAGCGSLSDSLATQCFCRLARTILHQLCPSHVRRIIAKLRNYGRRN